VSSKLTHCPGSEVHSGRSDRGGDGRLLVVVEGSALGLIEAAGSGFRFDLLVEGFSLGEGETGWVDTVRATSN
jgi:hypothetical protein